jgi:hypothetical protein
MQKKRVPGTLPCALPMLMNHHLQCVVLLLIYVTLTLNIVLDYPLIAHLMFRLPVCTSTNVVAQCTHVESQLLLLAAPIIIPDLQSEPATLALCKITSNFHILRVSLIATAVYLDHVQTESPSRHSFAENALPAHYHVTAKNHPICTIRNQCVTSLTQGSEGGFSRKIDFSTIFFGY